LASSEAAFGCRWPATEVIVGLDTNAPADRRVAVTAEVHPGLSLSGGRTHQWLRGAGPGAIALPASFGVTPATGGLRDPVVTLVVNTAFEPRSAGHAGPV